MPGILELTSPAELAALLARDEPEEHTAALGGVTVEIYDRGRDDAELEAPASSSSGAFVAAVIGDAVDGEAGRYARVWLPRPLAMDLTLSLRRPAPDGGELDALYDLRAANREYARRRLAPLAPLLVGFARRYRDVELRDDRLELGPLDAAPPEEVAMDLARVIAALAQLDTPSAFGDAPEAPSFCHFCGHGVGDDEAICPRCGERLDTDAD